MFRVFLIAALLCAPNTVFADPSLALAAALPERSRDLQALRGRLAALKTLELAAPRWPDPTLAVEYSNIPWDRWDLDTTPMSGVQLRVQQTLPFPGKNALRVDVARSRSALLAAELEELRLKLAGALRTRFWELALRRQLLGLGREQIALLQRLEDAVVSAYEVGRGGQHDLLRLQLLRAQLEDELDDYRRDETRLLATLNAALDRAPSTAVETPAQTPLPVAPEDLEALLKQAEDLRPAIELWRRRRNLKLAEAAHATRERWPDVTVWAGWRFRQDAGPDDGVDLFSLGVAVPLPVDYTGRRDAEAAGARQAAEAAQGGYGAAMAELRGELAQTLATWRRANDKAQRYEKTLVPQARATVDATLAAWQNGAADFASLFDAELRLLQLERAVRRARTSAMTAQVRIDTLTGAP